MNRFAPLLPALVALLLPASALACGGFFCSQVNLEPVQQNAERILFEIHGDGTITATVEIRYQGDPRDFSWVVPVPTQLGEEDLDVLAPQNALLLLDDATRPQVIPPPTECLRPDAPPSPFGNEVTLLSASDGGGDGVDVIDLPVVGPFEPQMLRADSADALVDWLNENDYLITPEMEPMVGEYVASGMWFLALKLRADAGVADIKPISMTYPGERPLVPIQLTGVAAEPEMGILTFIAADSRYEADNFSNLVIDLDAVQVHPLTGQQNYYPLLSWQMDAAGGQAVVTQFSDATTRATDAASAAWSWNPDYGEDLAWLDQLGEEHSQITRLYSRMSAWEMTDDPIFAESSGSAVSNVLDLSDRQKIDSCADDARDRIPCGDMYCGEGSSCGTTEWGDGCLCAAGTVARRISEPLLGGPGLRSTVVCDRLDSDMLGTMAEIGFSPGDPCQNSSCGSNGECVALNGFPTCDCDEGYAAVDDGAFLTCAEATETFDPERLLWQEGCDSDCNAGGGGAGGLLALFGLLGLVRRRGGALV